MTGPTLVDTGPLIAALSGRIEHSPWVIEQFKRLPGPLLTCEPVLTEAAFLLRREGIDPERLLLLMEKGVISLGFSMAEHRADLLALLCRYRDTSMSLADACLVRMAEIHRDATVFTLDSDFRIYRKHGRHVIPVLMP